MKIDNTSIRGFFVYSETSQYEAGDFVVFGNTIYVCSPKSGEITVQGEKPNESDNFYVYLGDQLADASDFIDFSENNSGEDKYITLSSLINILNTYMKGIDTSGIIGHEFVFDGDNVVYKVNNSITEVYNQEAAENILLDLLFDENINHGIFKVSKALPELRTFISDGDYCILRQYSYYSEEKKSLIRVQELIDVETSVTREKTAYANIYYRSTPISKEKSSLTRINFISATAHSECLAKRASSLFNLYSSRIESFKSKLKQLSNNFCFIKILSGNDTSSVDIQNSEETSQGYFSFNKPQDLGILTLIVEAELPTKENTEKVYSSNSLSIDMTLGVTEKTYNIGENLSLLIKISQTAKKDNPDEFESSIKIQAFNLNPDYKVAITTIYCRKNFPYS